MTSHLPVLAYRGFLRTTGAWVFVLSLLGAPLLEAQQYLLSPVAHQQFFTNTGVVAAGYKLCTFQAGTTTPLAIASDSSGTALTNPVTLNSAGRPQTAGGTETGIYLSQASTYKFILYASGTGNTCNGSMVGAQVWSQDNIRAGMSLNPICGSAISPCTTDVTGSTVTIVDTTSELTLANASANASLLQLSVNQTPVANVAASRSGSGTYPPLTFSTSDVERMRLLTTGPQLILGAASTDIPLAGNGGVVIVATSGGLAYATASTNASNLYLGRAVSSYMSVDSGATGSGTVLPLVLSMNGLEAMRVNTGLTVRVSSSSASLAPATGVALQVASGTSGNNTLLTDAFAGTAFMTLRRSNGTLAAPTQVLLNDALGAVSVLGYGTSGFLSGFGGQISFLATENWTNAAQGTSVNISTTTAGSTTLTLRATIKDGLVVGSSGADPGAGGIRASGAVIFTGLTSSSVGDYVCFAVGTSSLIQGTAPCTTSSERFKHDIAYDNTPGLDLVRQMKPIRFIRNDHPELGEQLGFKAEDVELLEPRLVHYDSDGLPVGFLYMNYTAVLTRAIQELEARVRMLEPPRPFRRTPIWGIPEPPPRPSFFGGR